MILLAWLVVPVIRTHVKNKKEGKLNARKKKELEMMELVRGCLLEVVL